MSVTIHAHDQATDGKTLREFVLEFLTERVTVRELLRVRIFQGVTEENARRAMAADKGGGPRNSNPVTLDFDDEFARAVEAFNFGRVIVLVDDKQLDDLATEVVVAPSTSVTFLRLVPLVGG
jgi:hypothetical protein